MHLRGTATVPADQARRPITAWTLSTLSIEAADKVAATGAQLRLAEHRRKRSHVGRRLARVLKMFGIEGMLLDRLREGNSVHWLNENLENLALRKRAHGLHKHNTESRSLQVKSSFRPSVIRIHFTE